MAIVRFYYDVEVDDFELMENCDNADVSSEEVIERAKTLLGYDIQDRAINVGSFEYEIVEEWEKSEEVGEYEVSVYGMETYKVYATSEEDAINRAIEKFMDDDMYCGSEEAENVTEDDCEIIWFEGN